MVADSLVRYLEETDSTNRVALELAGQNAPAGSLVVAARQTAGRGRLGKVWLSPPGRGLYFSLLLRPELPWADLPKITLAAGVGVCRAVEGITALAPRLKWPNDVLLADRKFCGILTETGPVVGADVPVVVIGVGMNVSSRSADFPVELRSRVTSLGIESGIDYDLDDVLAAVVPEIKAAVAALERGGFAGILAEWRQLDGTLGRELDWLAADGRPVRGISLGPDDEGVLRIRDRDGHIHAVLSGDLSLAGTVRQ